MNPFLLSGASFAALCVAAPAWAEDTPSSDTIVITATRSARSITDATASVSVVDSAQIEGTAAKTLDDVLPASLRSICRSQVPISFIRPP